MLCLFLWSALYLNLALDPAEWSMVAGGAECDHAFARLENQVSERASKQRTSPCV
jgi:hypothetical protein